MASEATGGGLLLKLQHFLVTKMVRMYTFPDMHIYIYIVVRSILEFEGTKIFLKAEMVFSLCIC